MEKIVIVVNKQEQKYLLLELMGEFFPECEVQTVTIEEETGREVSDSPPPDERHE